MDDLEVRTIVLDNLATWEAVTLVCLDHFDWWAETCVEFWLFLLCELVNFFSGYVDCIDKFMILMAS